MHTYAKPSEFMEISCMHPKRRRGTVHSVNQCGRNCTGGSLAPFWRHVAQAEQLSGIDRDRRFWNVMDIDGVENIPD
ncbi:unnamed protein product [Dibothriocephalus latus]|uniref:Uncharacterized protein n=1 Tax=Dibothriocephalus latus TaxID=60516 RepID=A0A3P7LRM2_DIBLA|nr:unnamed protein product [Dibothriocephalus latus]